VVIVTLIAASATLAAYEAVTRLAYPRPVSGLPAVAVAALVGFTGNELVARYRVRVGRKIGSAALVADGLHARADGFTSLAVLLGAGGAALGWDWADPAVGLVITVAILAVLRQAAREIYRRLMDAVDPALVEQAERTLHTTRRCWVLARSGCAGSATSSAPNARSSSIPTPARWKLTRWPWPPNTNFCTPCPGWPLRSSTPTHKPARALIRTRCWRHIGERAASARPAGLPAAAATGKAPGFAASCAGRTGRTIRLVGGR